MTDKLTAIRRAIKTLTDAGLMVSITQMHGSNKPGAMLAISDDSITVTHNQDGTATIGVAEVTKRPSDRLRPL